MEDLSKEILNDMEQDRIIAFCSDPILFNAVRKYILAVAYKQGVMEKGADHKATINFALNLAWGATQNNGVPHSDEELGQNLRALTYAVQLVESGFRELSEIRKVEPLKEEVNNPAE